jgi:hypothetical protein
MSLIQVWLFISLCVSLSERERASNKDILPCCIADRLSWCPSTTYTRCNTVPSRPDPYIWDHTMIWRSLVYYIFHLALKQSFCVLQKGTSLTSAPRRWVLQRGVRACARSLQRDPGTYSIVAHPAWCHGTQIWQQLILFLDSLSPSIQLPSQLALHCCLQILACRHTNFAPPPLPSIHLFLNLLQSLIDIPSWIAR